MEYEVKYKLNGTVGVYYINFSNNNGSADFPGW